MTEKREINFNVAGDPKDDTPYIQPDKPDGVHAIPFALGRGEADGFHEGAKPQNRGLAMIPNTSTGGAWVNYQNGHKRFRIILPPLDKEFQAEAGEFPQLPPEYNGDSDKVALHYTDDAVLPVLERRGRYFWQNGQRFFLNGKTGFNVAARFVYEGRDALIPMLEQSRALGFNAIRLWSAYNIPYIGRLLPREVPGFYSEIVPAVSHLCAEYGQYPYWTGLTGPYSVALGGMPEIAAHDQAMQNAFAAVPFVLYDRRNEYSKDVNQVDGAQLGPLFYDMASQGSGQQDEAPPTPLGRFYAYHPASGEWNRKTGKQSWDWSVFANVFIPGVDDETTRCEASGETNRRHAKEAGGTGALFVAGAFYHSALAKLGVLLTGTELDTAQGWNEGVQAIVSQGLDIAQDGQYDRPVDPAFLRIYVKTLGARSITWKIEND